MKPDLKELKLGARGRALACARRAVQQSSTSTGEALDEAFADFEPAPRRTDTQHHGPRASKWDAEGAAHEIAAQIDQIDEQRERLMQLLQALETPEA